MRPKGAASRVSAVGGLLVFGRLQRLLLEPPLRECLHLRALLAAAEQPPDGLRFALDGDLHLHELLVAFADRLFQRVEHRSQHLLPLLRLVILPGDDDDDQRDGDSHGASVPSRRDS